MIALTRRKQTVVLLKKVTNTFRQKQDLDLQVWVMFFPMIQLKNKGC